MAKEYNQFLDSKSIKDQDSGFRVKESDLNPMLFDFQKAVTEWALMRGRAAIFADCGLGKTPIQLDWASHVREETKKPVLIFAPLAVSKQTKREGDKFGEEVNVCRGQRDITEGINITNYEMLRHFNPEEFGGLVLDESSILKGYDGKFRQAITEFGRSIPYRLACTATPSPNDIAEIVNHSEFMGILERKEILSLFFTNRSQEMVQKWVLKKHAEQEFWKWLASWSVAFRMPSDLGFDNDGFMLPKLNMIQKIVPSGKGDVQRGQLFPVEANTLRERQQVRRKTTEKRVVLCADMINDSEEQWLVWCDLNYESAMLSRMINEAVEVKGADSQEHKESAMLDFQEGKIRILVTKPSIGGFGMNWQNCHKMAFVGLSDSYERLYQATRRCWRFGQKQEVDAYIIMSELEGKVLKNIQRKEKEAKILFDNVIKNLNLSGQLKAKREEMSYMEQVEKGKDWKLYLGDSVETVKKIEDGSVGLSVFSPPFPGMYVYTDSKRDVGNTKNIDELIDHFRFLVPELLRITMPGRSCCIHLTQAVTYKWQEGYSGIKDFRGRVIAMMEEGDWIYYGEHCIDKNPQVKAIRTKDRGLLFKTLSTDAAMLHAGMPDYLIQFRKHGDNPEPIKAGISKKYDSDGWITNEQWIEWAAPVWYRQTANYPGGIRETDVLNVRLAKDDKDEKHLAPLQLGVIERAVQLWTNPGDLVYSPFAGIGSEGYVALKLKRRFIGGELKKSYFDMAAHYLREVENKKERKSLNL